MELNRGSIASYLLIPAENLTHTHTVQLGSHICIILGKPGDILYELNLKLYDVDLSIVGFFTTLAEQRNASCNNKCLSSCLS